MERFFFGKQKSPSSEKPEPTESGKKPAWSKFIDLSLEEKRNLYRCGSDYVTLNKVPTWPEYREDNLYAIQRKKGKRNEKALFDVDLELNKKISLWRGDITKLEIDAIVNAANNSLLGGGGVDGCIHRAAGSTLRQECATLDGCATGDAKITSGHKLPAKYVIHTVGPIGEQEKQLKNCYRKCLELVKQHNIRTVAFCCISTGIYGYPIYDASYVALYTVRKWLEHKDHNGKKNADSVDRIIFCVFLGDDLDTYLYLIPRFFPSEDTLDQGHQSSHTGDDNDVETDEDEIKQGIPEPPQLGELLDEADTQADTEEVLNKNLPPAAETDTSGEETPLDVSMERDEIKQGIPEPPQLEDLLDEEDTQADTEEVVNNEEDVSMGRENNQFTKESSL